MLSKNPSGMSHSFSLVLTIFLKIFLGRVLFYTEPFPPTLCASMDQINEITNKETKEQTNKQTIKLTNKPLLHPNLLTSPPTTGPDVK